jgi:hypothetical protein
VTSLELAGYLVRIQDTNTPPRLQQLAREIERAHPDDQDATPLMRMAELKRRRIEREN